MHVCDRSFSLACVRSLAPIGMSSSNAEFHPSKVQDTADFVTKNPVTCWRTKVPRVSLYGVVKNKQLVAFTDSESQFYFVRCSRFAWPYKAREERTAIKRELLYLKNKCHTWPFIDLNISSLFILSYFVLYLSTFSNFNFSCHLIAAMARMLSLFSNSHYKFSGVFSISAIKFLQFYDSLLIVPYIVWMLNRHLSNKLGLSRVILYFAFWNYVASIPCLIFVSIIQPLVFSSLHFVFCNYVASLPCLTYSALKEKDRKVSRGQKRREYGLQNN